MRVFVTGGRGFLGKSLTPQLIEKGATVLSPSHSELDLTLYENVLDFFTENEPDIVIHAAVDGGGIQYMKEHPGSVYFNNIIMNSYIVEASRLHDVKKFVGIGTVCSYPKFAPVPFIEEDLWNGYPEDTNAPYGLAKKMLLVHTKAYHQQYGFPGIHLLMVNLYGPNDDFDLNTSHVIPAMIRKFIAASDNDLREVTLWGTGGATREFLYVEDAAKGILSATEGLSDPDPVNLGADFEISIKNLAEMISDLCGYEGTLIWDTSKPDGQPRRRLNTEKAKRKFSFEAETDLTDGLRKTIQWYRSMGSVHGD